MNQPSPKFFLWIFVFIIPLIVHGQSTETEKNTVKTEIKGFLDVFYAYDFNKPPTDYRQQFHFHHNRHNEFNINLGLIQTAITHEKYRANIGLQVGTYAIDNYAAEDPVLRHVFEANAGVSLNKENSLWLDAGLFGSHLGFESAISADNMTLTRSLAAENSPYFLTGAKLTFDPNDTWTIGLTVANGWQRIKRLPGNSLPAFGTQVNYHVGDKFSFNWSTLIGTDDPDSTRRIRIFNNWYTTINISEKMRMIAGFDFGTQEAPSGESGNHTWSTSALIVQYDLSQLWSVSFRAEHFKDDNEVIVMSQNTDGFSTNGYSLNFDYQPQDLIICRIEARWLSGDKEIYPKDRGFVADNFTIVGSLAVRWKN